MAGQRGPQQIEAELGIIFEFAIYIYEVAILVF